MASFKLSVPRLKGRENYDEWAFAAQNFLVLEGLQHCIQEPGAHGVNISETAGSTETAAEKAAREAKEKLEDEKAKAKLVLTIDSSLYVHIKGAKTAIELWTQLKQMFDDSGFTRRISLLRTLISTRLENCDSMNHYINQIVETSQRLRGTGFNIDDEWTGSILLAGLPEKYMPMIMAIEHSGIAITTDAIKSKLLDMESDVKVGVGAFYVKKKTTGKTEKKIQCYGCKEFGHYKSKCTKFKKSSDRKNETKTESAFNVVFLTGEYTKTDWFVDSGASVHLVGDESLFCKKRSVYDTRHITVANKTTIPVAGCGDVRITTVVEDELHNIKIQNALYVPDITTNLLSVSQLIKNGNKVIFKKQCCKIYNQNDKLVAIANLIDGVYKLNISQAESGSCLVASKACRAETWHRRFGHLNSADLQKMKNGAVDGLNCPENIDIGMYNCETCCEGKQHRLPFPKEGKRAENVLDIIHCDVCGPMENKSLGGSRYFLTFQDDHSRYVFVYFLKTKDEVVECFRNFKNLVENQQERKIKILRSDNGGEFVNEQMESILKKNGIIHQRTNAYTPQQNGVSERLNRTIVERAKCLLFDANLEKCLWAEAVHTAVYLRNRSLASQLNNKTPFEIWYKQKPNVSHLRIFGSTVMVHIPKEKRLKWDKKAEKKILVGYSENVKGYRVYDFKNHSVSVSRDVIILEDVKNNIRSKSDDKETEVSKEVVVSVGESQKLSAEQNDTAETPDNEHEIADSSSDSDETADSMEFDSNDDSYVPETEVDQNQENQPRRSQREPKPKQMGDYVTYLCAASADDPVTVPEAMSRPDAEKWKRAMAEEISSFEENCAWELVSPSEVSHNSLVECKWVFKKKVDSENHVRYRARLVAKGFTQKFGIDFHETFSPVVRHSTLRMLIALSVNLELEITHLDVTTAFLNGKLHEQVFMRQPEGFIVPGQENKVLKLHKAVYGLKQSSRVWYQRVEVVLSNLGYQKSKYEPCLFKKRNQKGGLTIIALYVDDFFIFSDDKEETKILKDKLSSEFRIKDLGQAKQCLGTRISIEKDSHIITLDQEQYINSLLHRFKMFECKAVATPMEPGLQLSKNPNSVFSVPYQELVGSLMYLSVMTRPDISYAVSYLSQFNNCYDETHWKAAKRILRYLQGTKTFCLKFKKSQVFELVGYIDADWASNSVDRKSYTGFCFTLSGSVISWGSSKQKTVALSSTEAEYMGLAEGSKEAIYLRNLLIEITDIKIGSVKLFNDNQGAQKLATNPVFHKRSKHIDVRHHFVRDVVANKVITLKYLNTVDMPADIFTKSLSSVKHFKFIKSLGLDEM